MAEEAGAKSPALFNLSAFGQVKLGQGVVGRTTFAAVIAFMALGAIGYAMKGSPYLQFAVCVMIGLGLIAYLAGVLWYANKHPQTSALEGADLVQWRQIEMAAANQPAQVSTANVAAPKTIDSSPRDESK